MIDLKSVSCDGTDQKGQNGNDNPSGSENGGTGDANGTAEEGKQEDNNGTSSENDSSENAAENQQESVQTADKTHSVWYLFGAAVSAMLAGFAGSKRKKKSDEEL